MTHAHEAPLAPPRCTACGHRMPSAPGLRPVETRRLPAWFWPAELIARLCARAMRGLETEETDHLGLRPLPGEGGGAHASVL